MFQIDEKKSIAITISVNENFYHKMVDEARYLADKLVRDINLLPLLPDEDNNNFLDFRK